MSDSLIVDVRKILVKDGNVLEVEMSQQFIDRLRTYFGLSSDQPLEDSHVKGYVLRAVDAAVSKAESGINENEDRPQGNIA